MLEKSQANYFVSMWNYIADECYKHAKAKGFHGNRVDEPTRIALIHSELSECLEAARKGNPPSEHIPEYSSEEEELADVVIRVMDMARLGGHKVGEAIIAKIAFNKTRPHMHGGKKF